MVSKKLANLLLIGSILIISSCRKDISDPEHTTFASLKEVPAVRLNYRFEPDVPAPVDNRKSSGDERNAAVQSDFDQNRPQELLDKTIISPDGKRVLVIYHMVADLQAEFRLDMYSPEGKILRKITADTMAVHFPDTILWSPDSTTVAFVAMVRGARLEADLLPNDGETAPNPTANSNTVTTPSPETNASIAPDSPAVNAETNINAEPSIPKPEPPAGVLTFRTEQIYIANADGDGVKPITQNEGLIYFYYVWSPDSSMLAAVAATAREWQFLQYRADTNGEIFVPVGRPRIVEKTGRERRLDDGLTPVQPVWSPDSAKVAAAFDKQVRVYDAAGNAPTQAAIPLRNYLLISSQAFDREQQRKLEAVNVPQDTNGQVNSGSDTIQPPTTLPDEKTLVSYNPIIAMNWPSDDQLYFQTAFVKRMKIEADSVTSFPRWHRLILTPQAAANTR